MRAPVSEPTSVIGTLSHPVKILRGDLCDLDRLMPSTSRVLMVTTKGFVFRGTSARIRQILGDRLVAVYDDVTPNPDVQKLADTPKTLYETINTILAVGGGSVIDTAKILSILVVEDWSPQIVGLLRSGSGSVGVHRTPLFVVPTTAGSGSEATQFATIWDHKLRQKRSLESPVLFPDVALLISEMGMTLSRQQTLFPALDTISHSLESLWNHRSTTETRSLSMQALKRVAHALPALLGTEPSLSDRAQMQEASALAGIAISHTRTAIAHSISYPLTIHYSVPHGLACSFVLPLVLRANMDALPRTANERKLLGSILALLEELELGKEIGAFVSRSQVSSVISEMTTSNRAGNYAGAALEVRSIVEDSLLKE